MNTTLLEGLTRFLPDLHASVRATLDVPRDLESAFGDPVAIATKLHELALEAGASSELPSVEAIATELRGAVSARAVASDTVDEEVAHTKAELVRHWFNCVRRAWCLWGTERGKIVLGNDESLLPDRRDCPEALRAEWDQYYSASKEGLFASIALDESGRQRAREEFARNIRRALDAAPVELPNSLLLKKEGSQILAVARA